MTRRGERAHHYRQLIHILRERRRNEPENKEKLTNKIKELEEQIRREYA